MPVLISEEDDSGVKTDSEDLTVGGPVSVHAPGLGLVFLDVGALSLPETELGVRAGGQRLKYRVESERLNCGRVGISD